ncbi:MAG: hypothetical protein SOW48_03010 [Peptoniphilaceae bacterium]|nr:hypothetical protein [Peptoniphilaceae bacterium]MDY3075598.1 hypothetical protein [Peptoniphilaceae bacterium]
MDIYRSRQARLVILFLFIMFLFLPIHTVHAAEGETTSDAITVTAEERQRIQSAGWYRSAESGRIFYITSELRTLTGLHEINGSLYLFNENGELYNINQWIHTEGKEFFVSPTGALYRNRFISFGESTYYYLGDDGSVQKGIIYVNGIGYYMDPSTGIMHKTNCWLKTGGERYFISPTGAFYQNRFISFGESEYYYMGEDGSVQTGLIFVNGNGYYMDPQTGIMEKEPQWLSLNGKRYFISPTGAFYQNRFISFGESEYYYMGEDGSVQTGLIFVNGNGYYMDPQTGIMEKEPQWLSLNGKRYFISPTGAFYRNRFITFGDLAYYMGDDGSVQTGLIQYGERKYYINPSTAELDTNPRWISLNGKNYFISPTGEFYRNRIITFGNVAYYMGSDSAVQSGIVWINGLPYRFTEEDGRLLAQAGAYTVDGKEYYADALGYPVRNQTVVIDGVERVYGPDGALVTEMEEPEASASEMIYTLKQFRFYGVIQWSGYKYTFYSETVLPGGGLNIPGRHVNEDGYVVDGDGYIVLANDAAKGTIFPTPFGHFGKVYDRGTSGNHLDVYIH